jgi:hypothetical protein
MLPTFGVARLFNFRSIIAQPDGTVLLNLTCNPNAETLVVEEVEREKLIAGRKDEPRNLSRL